MPPHLVPLLPLALAPLLFSTLQLLDVRLELLEILGDPVAVLFVLLSLDAFELLSSEFLLQNQLLKILFHFLGCASLASGCILWLILRFALGRDDLEGDHLVLDGLLLSRYLHNQLGRLRHFLSVSVDGTQLLVS